MTLISPLSQLVGTKVTDVDGAAVGYVLDLLIDKSDGKVSYVQIRLDNGDRGADGSLTVPWSTFLTDQKTKKNFQLRIHRAALGSLER